MHRSLIEAVERGRKGPKYRRACVGAVGLRRDGTRVSSANGAGQHVVPRAHAEARLVSKLDAGSIVYVGRSLADGTVAMAKPCKRCENALRARHVKRVVYTIGPDEWGTIEF